MSILDTILSRVPAAQDAQQKLNDVRAKFLSIPAVNGANKAALTRMRGMATVATDRDVIDTLLAKVRSVESGFASVVAQFSAFDDLKRSGAGASSLIAPAASLLSSAQNVQKTSDAVTAAVRPLAQKYGQPVTAGTGDVSFGSGALILGAGALVMVFLLGRKGRGKRR
jgi:hypothetical protein